MAQEATLHVKLDRDTDDKLRKLAYDRRTSKGQLVREAISTCYQVSFSEMPVIHRQAVSAYQGGFISLGKLAKAMGMTALEARRWLKEHGVNQNNAYGEEDAANA
jgi:predicted HTH domain antitoxin